MTGVPNPEPATERTDRHLRNFDLWMCRRHGHRVVRRRRFFGLIPVGKPWCARCGKTWPS